MPIYNNFGLIEIDEARIDETCNAYFKWKDLNHIFPTTVIEELICLMQSVNLWDVIA